ncbi:MAG TPA: cation transporter [Thermomicrobiales bacterium]|jgi:copper chaperone|nr:cation transporter [Thermomicrobiales bacterium]
MAEATTQVTTLTAPDISCGHCVSSVQNRLGGLEGIKSVVASAETKQIDLAFDPTKISLDKIKAELDDEGYPVQE